MRTNPKEKAIEFIHGFLNKVKEKHWETYEVQVESDIALALLLVANEEHVIPILTEDLRETWCFIKYFRKWESDGGSTVCGEWQVDAAIYHLIEQSDLFKKELKKFIYSNTPHFGLKF